MDIFLSENIEKWYFSNKCVLEVSNGVHSNEHVKLNIYKGVCVGVILEAVRDFPLPKHPLFSSIICSDVTFLVRRCLFLAAFTSLFVYMVKLGLQFLFAVSLLYTSCYSLLSLWSSFCSELLLIPRRLLLLKECTLLSALCFRVTS